MIKIYGFPTFNVTKVLLTAEELSLDYEFVFINLAKGDQGREEHRQRHPASKVPVLEHDGRYLYESAAICRYLARIENSALYPSDPWTCAQIDQYTDFATHHIGRWLGVYFFEEVIKTKFLQQESNQEAIAEAAGFLKTFMPVLNQQLEHNEFLTGNQITIADTIAWSYINATEATSASIDDQPHLNRWYQQISARPSVDKTMANYPAV